MSTSPKVAAPPAPAGFRRCYVNAEVMALAAGPDGGVIAGGRFVDGADLGGGPQRSVGADSMNFQDDGFVASYDRSGALVWFRAFGTHGDDRVTSLGSGADGSVVVAVTISSGDVDFGGKRVTGGPEGDSVLAGYDHSGALRWLKPVSSITQGILGTFAVGPKGHIALITGDRRGKEVSVVVLSPAGDVVWSRVLAIDPTGYHLPRISLPIVDGEGRVTIGGRGGGAIDFGDGPRVSKGGGGAVFAAQYAPDGKLIWAKHFTSTGEVGPVAIALDAGARVYLAGGFQGRIDFGGGEIRAANPRGFVVGLGAGGTHLWTQDIGAAPGTRAYVLTQLSDIAIDTDGNVWVVGRYIGHVNVGPTHLETEAENSTFTAKLGRDGTPLMAIDGEPGWNQSAYPQLLLVPGGALRIVPGGDEDCLVLGPLS